MSDKGATKTKEPQEFVVLRCKQCSMFQIHQSKKSPKFTCKVCGEKQSLSKVLYKGGTGDCRPIVQRLNSVCIEAEDDIVNEELMKYEDEQYEKRFDNGNAGDGELIDAEGYYPEDGDQDIEGNYVLHSGGSAGTGQDSNSNEELDEELFPPPPQLSPQQPVSTGRHVPIDYSKNSNSVNTSTPQLNDECVEMSVITGEDPLQQDSPKAKRSKWSDNLFP